MPSLTGSHGNISTSTPTFSGTLRAALAEAPSRIPLHPFGEFVGNGTVFLYDQESLQAALRDQAERGVPWVLDFHHQDREGGGGEGDLQNSQHASLRWG